MLSYLILCTHENGPHIIRMVLHNIIIGGPLLDTFNVKFYDISI